MIPPRGAPASGRRRAPHSAGAAGPTYTIRQVSVASWAVVNQDGRIVDRCVTYWDAAIRALRLVEQESMKVMKLEA